MSFSSLTMIRGSFPLSSHVHSPIINILCSFSCLPTEEKCKEITMKLFEMFRFKSTPIFNQITKQWEFLEVNPNINDHIITTNLNNEEECYNYIEYLSKTSFDHLKGKPYWIFHRIVNKGNGMSFLLMRVHHVIGDGIALVLAIDRIFTDSKGNPVKTALPSSKYDPKVVKELKEVNKQKTSFLSQIPTIISSFLRVISVATSNYDSDLLFTSQNKKKLVMNIKNQKILYLPTISLDYVKDLKNKANCTVNDILLGAMTGAIRRYCEKLNDPLIKSGESLQMRALLPVSFPRPDHEVNDMNRCLRNKWAFVSAPMPINEKTSKERVQSCLKTMNFIKTSPDAYVQLWLMNNILAYAPPFVVCETAQDSFSRHSIVFSNVPGPQNAIYYGSQEILGIQAIFPNILPQTIIMSYNGGIYGNLVVDTTIVKDHELLKETYLEELKELGKIYDVDTTKILKASS